ncbi:MAG: hypothetical protein Q8Q37_00870 [bacterium]|nr:hypothetical protein [bacterium]
MKTYRISGSIVTRERSAGNSSCVTKELNSILKVLNDDMALMFYQNMVNDNRTSATISLNIVLEEGYIEDNRFRPTRIVLECSDTDAS